MYNAVEKVVNAVPVKGYISITQLAKKLNRSKSSVCVSVNTAIKRGWLINDETNRGVNARLRRGKPIPTEETVSQKKQWGWAVYFMGNDMKLVKVGISKDPKRRSREISHASGINVCVLGVVWYNTKEEALLVEQSIHKSWAEYNTIGEWFNLLAEVQ